MVEFFYEGEFRLNTLDDYTHWIDRVIKSEAGLLGNISYIFCEDEYLLEMNKKYLNHDTLTDIITFDYSDGQVISGDIFISTERVIDNAGIFNMTFQEELLRVMVHGALHLLGYNDKTNKEINMMRKKEKEMIEMFHVEQ